MRNQRIKLVIVKILIIFFSLSLISPSIISENQDDKNNDENPIVSIVKMDETGIRLKIQLPEIEINEKEVNGKIYHLLQLPDYGYTLEVGLPKMPVIRETISIPTDVNTFSITVLDTSSTLSTGYNVYPVQTPEIDGNENDFVIDETFYQSDYFYPTDLIYSTNGSFWRDIQIMSIQINPIMYNPETTELKIYDYILFDIRYDSSECSKTSMSKVLTNIMDSFILNSDSIENTKDKDGTDKSMDYHYLAIADPNLENAVKPLVEWKNRRGLKTKLVNTSLTGTTPQNIKNYITTFYSSHSDLEYVLLVGDIDDLPWYGSWGVTGSDYWYGDIIGDLYPELAIGRITASTPAEVTQQVTKILRYEQNPPVGDWLDKALLVAHKEGAPGKYEGCSETIRTSVYNDEYTFMTAYGSQSVSNTDVNNMINNGLGILNYRGHGGYNCWCDGWTNAHYEGYYNSDVANLVNGNLTPIHYCIACNAGDLSSSDECLGEAFLKSDKAAIAFLGATEPSYTIPNHEFDQQLFQASGNNEIWNIGWISNFANTYLIDYYGASSYYMSNVKMYLWLGDPALEIWTASPEQLNVTHPLIIVGDESNQFNVTVTHNQTSIENATVCVENGDDFYQVGFTDENGNIQFDITNLSSGFLNVTVTKHNFLPYIGSADIPLKISLEQGWNFVSLPVDRNVEKNNVTLWDGNEVMVWNEAVNEDMISSYIFGWDRISQSYIFSDIFEPGYGYWMYANLDSEIWIDDHTTVNTIITNLEKDWNIASITENRTMNFSDVIIDCNGSDYTWADAVSNDIITNYVFGWDRISQSYMFSDIFEPGYGYWFNALQPCSLKKS